MRNFHYIIGMCSGIATLMYIGRMTSMEERDQATKQNKLINTPTSSNVKPYLPTCCQRCFDDAFYELMSRANAEGRTTSMEERDQTTKQNNLIKTQTSRTLDDELTEQCHRP
jgi:hypothetical protein